jgi:hypothetical protein
MIENHNDYIMDTEGAVDVVGDIDILEYMYREGIISESEYLRLAHPNPRFTFDELMAADWSPSELNF